MSSEDQLPGSASDPANLVTTVSRDSFYAALRGRLAEGAPVVILYLETDGIEELLVTRGPAARNQLVRQIGDRLLACAPERAEVFRAYEHRFMLICPSGTDLKRAADLSIELVSGMQASFEIDGALMRLSLGSAASSVRVGIARSPNHGQSAEELARASLVALYQARENGSPYAIYDSEYDRRKKTGFDMVVEMREELKTESNNVVVYYQPKLDVANNKCRGFEALVRWNHPVRGFLPPGRFLPYLETSEVMELLTEHVTSKAAQTLIGLPENDLPQSIAINISPYFLGDDKFCERLMNLVRFYSPHPSQVEFEITETAMMRHHQRARKLLGDLRELGARIFVDDFGTGHSSLAYLYDLPIDGLKIDKSFFLGLDEAPRKEAIIKAAATLGQELGLEVVAEGVETREMFDRLYHWGFDTAQGFFIARPMPAEDLEPWLDANSMFRPDSKGTDQHTGL